MSIFSNRIKTYLVFTSHTQTSAMHNTPYFLGSSHSCAPWNIVLGKDWCSEGFWVIKAVGQALNCQCVFWRMFFSPTLAQFCPHICVPCGRNPCVRETVDMCPRNCGDVAWELWAYVCVSPGSCGHVCVCVLGAVDMCPGSQQTMWALDAQFPCICNQFLLVWESRKMFSFPLSDQN